MNHFYIHEHVIDRTGEFPPGEVVDVKYISEVWLKIVPESDPTRPYFIPASRALEVPNT